jgi:hypothetical protein
MKSPVSLSLTKGWGFFISNIPSPQYGDSGHDLLNNLILHLIAEGKFPDQYSCR